MLTHHICFVVAEDAQGEELGRIRKGREVCKDQTWPQHKPAKLLVFRGGKMKKINRKL